MLLNVSNYSSSPLVARCAAHWQWIGSTEGGGRVLLTLSNFFIQCP